MFCRYDVYNNYSISLSCRHLLISRKQSTAKAEGTVISFCRYLVLNPTFCHRDWLKARVSWSLTLFHFILRETRCPWPNFTAIQVIVAMTFHLSHKCQPPSCAQREVRKSPRTWMTALLDHPLPLSHVPKNKTQRRSKKYLGDKTHLSKAHFC